jgi:FHS family L-fucose permease-like MFS transporter
MYMHDADRKRLAFGVVTAVFFMWGFITVLNDVLVPHLKAVFALDYTRIMLIQFCFFGAYFLMSLPSGKVVSVFGFKNSIIAGLCVAGVGALLFYPAAVLQSYGVFLTALFVLASGITLLQVAANPYVSLLGSPPGASSRLNLSQAFNSLGTTLAPKFGGLFILSVAVLAPAELAKLSAPEQITYRLQQASTVELPYIGIALTLFVLAVIVYLFHLPAVREMESPAANAHPYKEVLRHRHLFYGVIAIFLYVGAEVSIGSFMINYISLPGIGDMPEARAAGFVSLYWGGAMLGRFIGSALLRRIDARRLLGVFAAVAALLVLTTMLSSGTLAVASVVCIGLFNSIMFPNIFTLGIEGLGPLTGRASSLLIMAIVGGAIIPVAQGALADAFGVHHAFVLPLLCYLYIVFYAFNGSRLDLSPSAAADGG